jgi:prevent-host-death family protein
MISSLYELYDSREYEGGFGMETVGGRERTLGSSEAREVFPELVARAAYAHERVVIERRGRPMAALISVDELRLFERLLEEHERRSDTEAALAALANEDDEIVPFERST